MSSLGYRTARLTAQAQYRLRQKQTQQDARRLLKACRKTLASAKDPVLQRLLGTQSSRYQAQIDTIRNTVESSPNSALRSAQSLQKQINTAFAKAQVHAKQIHLEQLKEQAGATLDDTTSMLRQIHDPSVQQLIGPEIRKLQPQIQSICQLIQKDPKKATAQSKALQKKFHKLLGRTQKQLEKESKAKAQAYAELEEIKQHFEAFAEGSTDAANGSLQHVQTLIGAAEDQYRKGQFKALTESCRQAKTLLSQASEKEFDETVRKEVVHGLLTTLTQMGFVVQPPYLEGEEEAGQTVRLSGKLPSGKMAAFNVYLDGRMDFDFDGYEGKACAKELEKIDTMLNQQFSIQLGENQITWKNPDRIAKGAMQLPSGRRNSHLR